MSVQSFDPFAFPLSGEGLIEASAGTGKTYSITSLFIRVLLGLETDAPLAADKLLVVTFTNAASAELKKRIHHRTVQVYRGFLADTSEDAFIIELLARVPDKDDAILLLDAAQRQMDEAAIFTIHGFCHRVLKESSFESGRRFDLELIQDESNLRQQAAEDFWRRHVVGLDAARLAIVKSEWQSPVALLKALGGLIGSEDLTFEQTPQDTDQLFDALSRQVAELKQQWLDQDIPEFFGLPGFKKNAACKSADRLQAMTKFAHSDALIYSLKKNGKIESFETWAAAKVQASLLKSATLELEPIFERFTDVAALAVEARQALIVELIHRAVSELKRDTEAEKDRLDSLSNDDLLTGVRDALLGPGGDALADSIATAFPLAMVDEFQDTDSVQYQIFKRIYSRPSALGWVMIGDPKQAIYKFRGADVFTYMQARRDVLQSGQPIYGLSENWRSSSAMVASVNQLFERAENRSERGAFIYKSDIPYPSASAADKADKTPMLRAGRGITPLHFCQLLSENGKALNKGAAQASQYELAAEHVARLLGDAARGELLVGEQPLQARQVAVLVRTNYEAQAMQTCLRRRGVNSAFLTRDSVFGSTIAMDLYFLLEAVANPRREKLIFTALATRLLGVSAADLATLEQDLVGFQRTLEQFADYQQSWQAYGLMPMLRQLSEQRGLVARLRNEPDGDRLLTDFRHLSELLQQVSLRVAGQHGLLLWYRKKILETGRQDSDEEQLRLESEKDLVQIVTQHKSKGLEYNVVVIPSLSASRPDSSGIYHNAELETVVDLLGSDESAAAIDKERLAEELRLSYVALTRSAHHCYVGLANIAGRKGQSIAFDKTAMGYLLGVDQDKPDDALISEKLHSLQADAGESLVAVQLHSVAEPVGQTVLAATSVQGQSLSARAWPSLSTDHWYMTSYSALVRGVATPKIHQGAMDEPEAPAGQVLAPALAAHSFPRGPRYGTLLHALLETLDFTGPPEVVRAAAMAQLQRYGVDAELWVDFVISWMAQVVQVALLPEPDLRIGDLPAQQQLPEMEFCFSLGCGFRISELCKLAQAHGYLGSLTQLSERTLAGMMKGFIDLVFEYQGRFYLADYKSNYLGDHADAYAPAVLGDAIAAHHYDLQYLIYTVALHRYLGLRIRGYQYSEHFGGVYYLYLRGMLADNPAGSGIYFDKPPQALVLALDQLLQGGTDG